MHRPRLTALLADEVRCPVTLVSGPPGAGKTTLLVDWLRSARTGAVAWLTLDERDDEPGRLAELVVEALRRAGALDGPVDRWSSGRTLLDAAYQRLMERDTRSVLVLEAVQELRSRSGLRTLAHVVEGAPRALDVVLSTRADPPIGWSRMLVGGRLGQIRYADLAFTEAEAAELAAAHGVELSREDLGRLWARVDGWVGGLRLALDALQREPDPHRFVADAAATDAVVSEYLLTEALARQDGPVQEFLLRTSVADRLTADLAAVLTGSNRSEEILLDLVRRGLFVIEADHARWYRAQPLFRTLLRAQLRVRHPQLITALHGRAAAWHLATGMKREAETHARAAGAWPLVGRLTLERWLPVALDGGAHADDALTGVPAATVLRTPELALIAATEACRWAERDDADLYRGAVDGSAAMGTARPDLGEPGSAGATVRQLLDVAYGWVFGGDERSQQAIATLRGRTATDVATPRLRQLAQLAQAEQDLAAGDLDRARGWLEDLASQGAGDWHRMLASAVLALVDAATGLVRTAQERAAAVFDRIDDGPVHPATGDFAHLALAVCAAQQAGQRRASEALAAIGEPLEWSSRSLRAVHRAVRAAIAGRAPFYVRLDAGTVRHPLAERALVALGVLQVVDLHGRPLAVAGPGERLVLRARDDLAEDGLGRSDDALVGWLDGDDDGDRHPRTQIEAGVLAALAAHQRDDPAAADRRLSRALELSTATGVTAPLLIHAAPLGQLLDPSTALHRPRTGVTIELLDRLQHTGADRLVQPLTDREVEVLQRLPMLMSNTEIAAGLQVSVNTVKSHLKAVYRKLGVDSRREAVQRGRALELI